ncbi:MAG TPA: hypothetical protein EYP09_04750 [Anaerolineae bacterium]|nr:hypothetical protein [Anaerolineae bacterium]
MIRPFVPWDILFISKLQRRGVALDLEDALTQPHRPLLAAYFSPRIYTCVLSEVERGRRREGFAQMREGGGRPAAEVVYLAPALSVDEEAPAIWRRLLAHLSAEAGRRGIQRLFARLPEDGPEVGAFQQAGFGVYVREDIFRLARAERPSRSDRIALRRQRPADEWGLQQLYAAVAPRSVRQSEGLGCWEDRRRPRLEGYVLEEGGEIVGYLGVGRGRLGHRLRVMLHPRAYQWADGLIEYGLSLLAEHPPRPIYCCVRRYQGGLREALEARGFQLFASQAVLVKHIAVRAEKPVVKLVPALEKRAGAATTVRFGG